MVLLRRAKDLLFASEVSRNMGVIHVPQTMSVTENPGDLVLDTSQSMFICLYMLIVLPSKLD